MSKSKNDEAWEALFEKHSILERIDEEGSFHISSSDINTVREARLMTKFDSSDQLPDIFYENKISILPVSRGKYVLSNFHTFHEFTTNKPEIINVNYPEHLQSVDTDISSESMALNFAYVTGITSDFLQDDEILPTVNGRMSSKKFDFDIHSPVSGVMQLSVNNSQIEIDGGYEGITSLSLFEVKNSISEDFIVRQLYYPYRLWSNKIEKEVRPIFLTYSNGVFHFREYAFSEPSLYNSLGLVKEAKYVIKNHEITLDFIEKYTYGIITYENEPSVPFPQADSIERVFDICEQLKNHECQNNDDIATEYAFVGRQADYYTRAAMYLGLVDKQSERYVLTPKGKELFYLNLRERQMRLVKLILSFKVFNLTVKKYLELRDKPDRSEVIDIMQRSNLNGIGSYSTFDRRASTVLSWVEWVFDQIEG